MDYSKGVAFHRLYGHQQFVDEARRRNKDGKFITDICRSNSIACTLSATADSRPMTSSWGVKY